jgi:hypothetical protein
MQWNKVSKVLPVFDENGWAHNLLFWDGDTLYSGSCENRGGDPVFIDWWVGGCDVNAQWWAPWPKKPTAEPVEGQKPPTNTPIMPVIIILEDHNPVCVVDSMEKFHAHNSGGKEKTWLSFDVE